jgi:hypothetical protein
MCSDRRRHVRARAQSAVRCINTIVFQDADRSFVEDRLCEVAPAVPEATKEQVPPPSCGGSAARFRDDRR